MTGVLQARELDKIRGSQPWLWGPLGVHAACSASHLCTPGAEQLGPHHPRGPVVTPPLAPPQRRPLLP